MLNITACPISCGLTLQRINITFLRFLAVA